MNALSRREEESLLKIAKAKAMKECDPVVKEFAECATGRSISVLWACREKYKRLQECVYQFTNPESLEKMKADYVRSRDDERAALGTKESK